MRITSGKYAGRRIAVPKGPRIRETTDLTRKNLFNLLGDQMADAKVLDLFCGTGSLGISALSHGAAGVTFVDRSRFCLSAVRENLKQLSIPTVGPEAVCRVMQAEAVTAIRRLGEKGEGGFQAVFLDPPYGGDLARKALNALGRYAIVASSGIVIAEHDKRDPLPDQIQGEQGRLILQRHVRYGDTALTIYQKQ